MVNKKIWLGILVLVFGMMIFGCDGGSNNNDPGTDPPQKNPLTGTVTVSSDVTINTINGNETMKLTADISGLNGDSLFYSYQWMRDGADISSAKSKTYDVVEADYGKTVRVKVTSSALSGEKFGEIAVPNPTKLTLTLKWDNAAGKKDTGITIERKDGDNWASTSGNLTTSGTTVTLTSWIETEFKMRTTYTNFLGGGTKFYFQKDNALGSELFDLTNGTKTYTLTNMDGGFGTLTGLFATEG
jgi:hypothetical protein